MRMTKRMKVAIVAGALSLTALTVAIAYFSGVTDTKQNTFNIVAGEKNQEGAGTIIEENWVPEDAKNMQPGKTVAKDPKVQSNVDYDSYVYVVVDVPTMSAKMAGDDAEKTYDCITYTVNSGWTDVTDALESTACADYVGASDVVGESSKYVYRYDTALEAGATTTTLFDNISVKDFDKIATSSSMPKIEGSVDVYGYMIQTEGYETPADSLETVATELAALFASQD